MQVLVIAVQNAVDYRDLGVATSGATLFRLIGGSIGTAVLGAIFASRLGTVLPRMPPPGAAGAPRPGGAITTEMLAALSPTVRAVYSQAFATSLSTVFLVASVVACVGFALAWLLPEHPLRATISAQAERSGGAVGQAFAMPVSRDSLAELRRGLAALADRETRIRYIERIIAEAQVPLGAVAAWLLVRLEQDPGSDPVALGRAHHIDAVEIDGAIGQLVNRGLIAARETENGAARGFGVTRDGCEALGRLIAVRRAHLADAAAEWAGNGAPNVADVRDVARELVPDARSSANAGDATASRTRSSD
jgi:hypothetical protein